MTTTAAKRDAHESNLFAVSQLAGRAGMDAIKAELAAFLRSLEPAETFQAVDFTRRLWRLGLVSSQQSIDLRSVGSLYLQLKRAGVIIQIGYAPDGGNTYTNHHSAVRPVYRIADLAKLTDLGWEVA